jgi:hypothetical protein
MFMHCKHNDAQIASAITRAQMVISVGQTIMHIHAKVNVTT